MNRSQTDRATGLRMPRSRGAVTGLLLVILGAWGALIPFVGPHFNFAYTPDRDWVWTTARGWLEVFPGVTTAVGGVLLVLSGNRAVAMLGGWLAVLGGAWFVVGGQHSSVPRSDPSAYQGPSQAEEQAREKRLGTHSRALRRRFCSRVGGWRAGLGQGMGPGRVVQRQDLTHRHPEALAVLQDGVDGLCRGGQFGRRAVGPQLGAEPLEGLPGVLQRRGGGVAASAAAL